LKHSHTASWASPLICQNVATTSLNAETSRKVVKTSSWHFRCCNRALTFTKVVARNITLRYFLLTRGLEVSSVNFVQRYHLFVHHIMSITSAYIMLLRPFQPQQYATVSRLEQHQQHPLLAPGFQALCNIQVLLSISTRETFSGSPPYHYAQY